MTTICRYESEACRFNSLDRRDLPRESMEVAIYTCRPGRAVHPCPVIECSSRGARVVLNEVVALHDFIPLLIQYRDGRRRRVFARIAWTSILAGGASVAGLEFQRQDYSFAS